MFFIAYKILMYCLQQVLKLINILKPVYQAQLVKKNPAQAVWYVLYRCEMLAEATQKKCSDLATRQVQLLYQIFTSFTYGLNKRVAFVTRMLIPGGWMRTALEGVSALPNMQLNSQTASLSPEGFEPLDRMDFVAWAITDFHHGIDRTNPGHTILHRVLNTMYTSDLDIPTYTSTMCNTAACRVTETNFLDLHCRGTWSLGLGKVRSVGDSLGRRVAVALGASKLPIASVHWVLSAEHATRFVIENGSRGESLRKPTQLAKKHLIKVSRCVAKSLLESGAALIPTHTTSYRNSDWVSGTKKSYWMANAHFLRTTDVEWTQGEYLLNPLMVKLNDTYLTYAIAETAADIHYQDFQNNWAGAVSRIYDPVMGFHLPAPTDKLTISYEHIALPEATLTAGLFWGRLSKFTLPKQTHLMCYRPGSTSIAPIVFMLKVDLRKVKKLNFKQHAKRYVFDSPKQKPICFKKPRILRGIKKISQHDNFSILRITHAFSKSRFSRSRQYCRPIVIWSLYINIGLIYSCHIFFYGVSFNVGYVTQLVYLGLIPYLVYYSVSGRLLTHARRASRQFRDLVAIAYKTFQKFIK